MRPALLRRVALASQRRLKSTAPSAASAVTAASPADAADAAAPRTGKALLSDFDVIQASTRANREIERNQKAKNKSAVRRRRKQADAEAAEAAQAQAEKTSRPEIKYETNVAAKSMERMAFFAGEEVFEGDVEAAEDVPGIEVGRVVELRR